MSVSGDGPMPWNRNRDSGLEEVERCLVHVPCWAGTGKMCKGSLSGGPRGSSWWNASVQVRAPQDEILQRSVECGVWRDSDGAMAMLVGNGGRVCHYHVTRNKESKPNKAGGQSSQTPTELGSYRPVKPVSKAIDPGPSLRIAAAFTHSISGTPFPPPRGVRAPWRPWS